MQRILLLIICTCTVFQVTAQLNHVFNVRDFGATGEKSVLATKNIQQTIDGQAEQIWNPLAEVDGFIQFETGDDAICLKTTNLEGEISSCENIIVDNCICISTSTGLKLGTESYGDFKNIHFIIVSSEIRTVD